MLPGPISAPKQHSSEKTLEQWQHSIRFYQLGIEPETIRTDGEVFNYHDIWPVTNYLAT